MSMQTMQTVLWRAVVDRQFQAILLSQPAEAVREYDLDAVEASILTVGSSRSLADLAVAVEAWRRGEPAEAAMRELALAS
jgi:hypothetical protein